MQLEVGEDEDTLPRLQVSSTNIQQNWASMPLQLAAGD